MERLMATRCTGEQPWGIEKHSQGPVIHQDAVLVWSDYYADYFECANCGLKYERTRDAFPPMDPHGQNSGS